MAPPAKRRKRNRVESDEDEDEDDWQPLPQQKTKIVTAAAPTTPRKNNLKNYLFSSPSSKQATDTQVPPPPPSACLSPVRKSKRSTTAAAAAAAAATTSPSSAAPTVPLISNGASNFLTGRAGRASKASTKSPSTSPEKKGRKGKLMEEKGKSADLVTLFSKQTQRLNAIEAKTASTSTSAPTLDDITSDPISEDDEVAETNAAVSSVVGSRAHKRFRDGSATSSLSSQLHPPSSSFSASSAATSHMFLKPPRPIGAVNGTCGATNPAPGADLRPWSDRFAPVGLEELAVHKKKVSDVRRWLEDVLHGRMRQRLLILKGPAGSAKTTTLQLLARELRCEVLEWRNPTGSALGGVQGFQSASAQFEEFMGRGGKFGQLDLDDENTPPQMSSVAANGGSKNGTAQLPTAEEVGHRLMLVEEFPNTFMRSSSALTSFRNVVLHFLATNTPSLATFGSNSLQEPVIPVVMVISETLLTTTSSSADSFTAHRLLGPEILRHPGTGIIEFNAIAPSILVKALELVVQKEARKSGRRRTPGPLVLKKLADVGDIRNAISSLEFLCVKGDKDSDWGAKVTFTKAKRGSRDVALTKGERETLELVSQREASLGIFHAVGKVVYNKRDDIPYPPGSLGYEVENLPGYMSRLSRPKQSMVSVDTLIDETGTDTSTFISALHENYVLSCEASNPRDTNSSVDYINGCVDRLSEADLLCPSWDVFFGGRGYGGYGGGRDLGSHILRQDEMAFEIAVRGLLFTLPSPVKRQSVSGTGNGGGGGGHASGRGGDQFKMFFPTSIKLWRAKEELESVIDMWVTKMLNGEDGPCYGGGSGSGSGDGNGNGNGSASSRRQTQNLTNGATAFRKPKMAGSSVGDWATNRSELKPALSFGNNNHNSSSSIGSSSNVKPTTKSDSDTKDAEPAAPLLYLGNSARKEMLLERLPYMAHMARRRRGSFMSMGLRDLEKIVSFQGIGPQSGAVEDDSEALEAGDDQQQQQLGLGGVAGESWATDRPTDESSPRKKRVGFGALRSRRRAAAADAAAAGADGAASGDGDGLHIPSSLQVHKLVLSDDDIEDD